MKRMIAFALMLCLMLSLAACGQKDSGKQDDADQDKTTVEEQADQPMDNETDASQAQDDQESGDAQEEKTISGVVNKVDDYLVLLDNDGEYRIFDFDKELDPSKFAEGDKVTVTYTGELGSEDPAPVAVLIQKDA